MIGNVFSAKAHFDVYFIHIQNDPLKNQVAVDILTFSPICCCLAKARPNDFVGQAFPKPSLSGSKITLSFILLLMRHITVSG